MGTLSQGARPRLLMPTGRGTQSCLRPSCLFPVHAPAAGQPSDLGTKNRVATRPQEDSGRHHGVRQRCSQTAWWEGHRYSTAVSHSAQTSHSDPACHPSALCSHPLFPPQTLSVVYFPTVVASERKNHCESPSLVWSQHHSYKISPNPCGVREQPPPSTDLLSMETSLAVGEGARLTQVLSSSLGSAQLRAPSKLLHSRPVLTGWSPS